MKVSLVLLVGLLALALFFDETYAQNNQAKRRRQQQRRTNKRNRNRNRPRERDCGPIPHIPFGAALHDGTNQEQRYACQAGFVLLGTDVIECIHGIWATAPRCVQQSCPQVPAVPFATFILENVGLTVTYTCSQGYSFTAGSSRRIRCHFGTQTWATAPVCQSNNTPLCGAPPAIGNARSTVSVNGNLATYSCNTGYKFVADRPTFIQCTHFQWQTSVLPACEPKNPTVTPTSCGAPSCGGSTIDPGPTGDSTAIGGTVVYTCREGLRISGSNDNTIMTYTAVCGSDGTWPAPPTCEPKNCGVPPAGVNTNPIILAPVTTVGSVAVYSCLTNYEVANPVLLIRTCQVDGTWSGSTPVCSRIECPVSAIPTHTNAQADNANNILGVGETKFFICNSGYVLSPATQPNSGANTFQVTCQVDKTYTTTTSRCVYQYPASCQEFVERRAAGGTAIPVGTFVSAQIDLDGPGTAQQVITVDCALATSTEVCTRVIPTFGALNSFTTSDTCANRADVPGEFGSISNNAVDRFCNTGTQGVSYPLTETQIIGLIAGTLGTCSQTVRFTCTPEPNDNVFLGLITNRPFTTASTTTVYAYQYAPGSALLRGPAVGGACDCSTATSTCTGDCNCGTATTATSDTVTLYLTNANPNYVTSTILGVTSPVSTLPIVLAGPTSAAVGGIQCCHSTV